MNFLPANQIIFFLLSSSEPMGAVYAPPHLYGQLVKHSTGCQLLLQYDCLAPLLDALQFAGLDNERDIGRIKSSLWALVEQNFDRFE